MIASETKHAANAATFAASLRRSARLSVEAAGWLTVGSDDLDVVGYVDEAIRLLDEATGHLRDSLRERGERERDARLPTPDASLWLTREEVCDVLQVTPETVRAWARRGSLSTRRARRLTARGDVRRVTVYDPGQLAALAGRRVEQTR